MGALDGAWVAIGPELMRARRTPHVPSSLTPTMIDAHRAGEGDPGVDVLAHAARDLVERSGDVKRSVCHTVALTRSSVHDHLGPVYA